MSREKAAELAEKIDAGVQQYEEGWNRASFEDMVLAALSAARREAIEEAAKVADELFNGFHSPYEYAENVSDAIRRTLKEEPSDV